MVAGEMRIVRTFDWKFWLALACAVMVFYLSFVGYQSVRSSQDKDERIDHLITSLDQRSARAAQDRHDARLDRLQAQEERDLARKERQTLVNYINRLTNRQRDVLRWLDENGIEIPTRFITQVQPPRVIERQSNRQQENRAPQNREKRRLKAQNPQQRGRHKAASPGKSGQAPKGKKNNRGKGKRGR